MLLALTLGKFIDFSSGRQEASQASKIAKLLIPAHARRKFFTESQGLDDRQRDGYIVRWLARSPDTYQCPGSWKRWRSVQDLASLLSATTVLERCWLLHRPKAKSFS